MIAATRDRKLCVWRGGDLSFLGRIDRPAAVAQALDRQAGILWLVDSAGHLLRLDPARWADGFRLMATLSGHVAPAAADSLVNDPETHILRGSIVQHDFAGDAARIWALPDQAVETIAPFVLPVKTTRFDLFRQREMALIEAPAHGAGGVPCTSSSSLARTGIPAPRSDGTFLPKARSSNGTSGTA